MDSKTKSPAHATKKQNSSSYEWQANPDYMKTEVGKLCGAAPKPPVADYSLEIETIDPYQSA